MIVLDADGIFWDVQEEFSRYLTDLGTHSFQGRPQSNYKQSVSLVLEQGT